MIKKLGMIILLCWPMLMWAAPPVQKWHTWLAGLRQEAIAQGIQPAVFDKIFRDIKPHAKLVRLDRSQPERRITYKQYIHTRADAYRLRLGRREFRRYKTLLSEAGKHYGVNPYVIVSIWGLETSYGRFKGNFDVVRSLSTLAYDGRRSAFFRKELLLALHMLNDGVIARQDFKGEWAGASGHPQFLPSSWHHYAVDFNRDGRKDIWKTLADAFASIANYLHMNGWQDGQPILAEVTVPPGFSRHFLGLKTEKSLSAWRQLGVRLQSGEPRPASDVKASLIYPDGGPYILAYPNFKVLLKWNRSTYYVGTVNYMIEQTMRAS